MSHRGAVYVAAAPVLRAHSANAGAWIHRGDGASPWTPAVGPLPGLPRLAAGADLLIYALGTELHESHDSGNNWSKLGAALSGPARALLVV